MKQYLFMITGEFRAERPSEDFLNPDNTDYLTQDATKDRWVIKKTDRSREIAFSEIIAEEQFSPIKRVVNDGYIVLQYPNDDNDMTFATTLRVGSKCHVQYTKKDNASDQEPTYGTNVYDTIAEGDTFIATLSASDGYVMIDEASPSDSPTSQIIKSRPPLYDLEGAKISGKLNKWSRTDTDRY